jgi:hypothetical protein
MSNSIRQIPVKGNTDCIALEKARIALEDALRAVKSAQRQFETVPPVDMDEIRVRYWLRGQDGLVTAAHVADVLFGNRPQSKSLSMSMAKYLKAAGWYPARRVQGTQYWARGASAERVS